MFDCLCTVGNAFTKIMSGWHHVLFNKGAAAVLPGCRLGQGEARWSHR